MKAALHRRGPAPWTGLRRGAAFGGLRGPRRGWRLPFKMVRETDGGEHARQGGGRGVV